MTINNEQEYECEKCSKRNLVTFEEDETLLKDCCECAYCGNFNTVELEEN